MVEHDSCCYRILYLNSTQTGSFLGFYGESPCHRLCACNPENSIHNRKGLPNYMVPLPLKEMIVFLVSTKHGARYCSA